MNLKTKKSLVGKQVLERIEKLFNYTNYNGNNFKAAEIVYKDTKYEASFSLIKHFIFWDIWNYIWNFYVLISNAIPTKSKYLI